MIRLKFGYAALGDTPNVSNYLSQWQHLVSQVSQVFQVLLMGRDTGLIVDRRARIIT